MRKIGFILLAISVILGGAAIWGIRSISTARAAPDASAGQTTIVVATRPIGFGEPVTPEVVRTQAWPKGATPQGSFTTVAELTSQKRVALGPISANEPILKTRISGPGGRATLSGVIRPGMRATAIRVNDVFGVAGFVLPGDFVDVLITRDEEKSGSNSGANMRTDVLVQSVRVLAVDQLANENKNDPVVAKAATIEVTPAQAQQLALAAQVGTLSLALRGAIDPLATPEEGSPQTTRITDLRLDGRHDAPQTVRPKVTRVLYRRPARPAVASPTIEIHRGAQSAVSVPALRDAAAG